MITARLGWEPFFRFLSTPPSLFFSFFSSYPPSPFWGVAWGGVEGGGMGGGWGIAAVTGFSFRPRRSLRQQLEGTGSFARQVTVQCCNVAHREHRMTRW